MNGRSKQKVGYATLLASASGATAAFAFNSVLLSAGVAVVAVTLVVAPMALLVDALMGNVISVGLFPEGAGAVTVALALAGSVGLVAQVWPQQVWLRSRVRSGHAALLLLGLYSLVVSAFEAGVRNELLILTLFASIPLGFAAVAFRWDRVPGILIFASAVWSVGLMSGLLSTEFLNPISFATVAWASGYFILVGLSGLRRVLALPLVVFLVVQWLTTNHLGPLISGSCCFAVWLLKSVRRRGDRAYRPIRILLTIVALALTMAVAGVALSSAADELNESSLSNSSWRAYVWTDVVNDFDPFGRGITDVEVETSGIAGVGTISGQSHNFVIDTLHSTGVVGIAFLAIVLVQAWRGLLASSHPMAPYCVGWIVAILFSGGLFRSPVLWFALAFLIAEQRRKPSGENHSSLDERLRAGSIVELSTGEGRLVREAPPVS